MSTYIKKIFIISIILIITATVTITVGIMLNQTSLFMGKNVPVKHLTQFNEIYITPNNVIMNNDTYSGNLKLIICVPYSNSSNSPIKIYINNYYQGTCTKSGHTQDEETYTKIINLNLYKEGENRIQICDKNDKYINSFTITINNFPIYQTGTLSDPNNNTINISLQYQNGVLSFDKEFLIITNTQQVTFSVLPYPNISTCRWYKDNVLYSENMSTTITTQTNYTIRAYINSTYITEFSTYLPVTINPFLYLLY